MNHFDIYLEILIFKFQSLSVTFSYFAELSFLAW